MGTEAKPFSWASCLAKLSLVLVVILVANIGASRLIDSLEIQIWPEYMEIVDRTVLIGVVLYVAMMAAPFLPGIEIGLALMIALGPKGVVVIYFCTLIALTISFGLGRLLPAHLLAAFLRWLALERAAALLETFNATPAEKRLPFLAEKVSPGRMPALLRGRYLLLALLLNLPGNVLLGGGGGIAMMAGMSRLYSFPVYLLLIAVAVLPGPLLIALSKSFN